MAAELEEDYTYMSFWARSFLSSFAQKLNKVLKRRGPVGQGRPKTVVVEDQEGLMRLMFYHDWNPVAAGMCKHPSEYYHSSYNFYAFGKTNKWTEHITPPQWYIDLGDTPDERQTLYRLLCDKYWEERKKRQQTEEDLQALEAEEANIDDGCGIGSEKFVDNRTRVMRSVGHIYRYGYPRAPGRKKSEEEKVERRPVSGPSFMPREDLLRMTLRVTTPGGGAAAPVARPGRPIAVT